MATIKKFEDLIIRQLARAFNRDIIPISCRLDETRSYGLKNQLDDAGESVWITSRKDLKKEAPVQTKHHFKSGHLKHS